MVAATPKTNSTNRPKFMLALASLGIVLVAFGAFSAVAGDKELSPQEQCDLIGGGLTALTNPDGTYWCAALSP